ncbi:Alanyl-tRNA synthetase [Histomonas meleagridis]|uniref:Alanyl-tRNA synthetase n=1 Tax=Histomonas meleagridis TaxID=135588 RepID=UPI00355A68EC|nr:Alanyl-tRNA synthetase [Histomonas meleagridis]KAH0801256.1 Alanyl-tRNA synthetase [Histomonas meleagridis]
MSNKNYDPQMHTTEHILNRTMVNLFDCGRSFSTHLEKKKSKCDYHFEHNLTPEEKQLIEKTVNDTIQKDLEVKIFFVPPDQALQMDVDVSKLPKEALEKDIRIVQIGDYDTSACIGSHVSRTSDIKGIFRITSTTFDNGVLRMRWVVK